MSRVIALLVLALSAALSGCVTERVVTSDGRPMPPDPRRARSVPAGASPTRMAFFVGSKPLDTNGNGFPDTIEVQIYLFAPPYASSTRASGAFEFSLYPKGTAGTTDARPLVRWRREASDVARAEVRGPSTPGPAYRFRLSLLDAATDVLPLQRADLVCRYLPDDGSPEVSNDGIRTIQVGSRLARTAGASMP